MATPAGEPNTSPNTTPESNPVTGPASYFPSIEKKYGHPIDFWFAQLDTVSERAHMEQVVFLKQHYGIGHGHANALVAVYRKRLSAEAPEESR